MSWQRTSATAVVVAPEQLAEAIEFYQRAFDMSVSERSEVSARLTGTGFTIWLHVGAPAGLVFQEFETGWVSDAVRRLRELGCEPVRLGGESEDGPATLLKDPYGMTFHVI